MEKFEFEYMEIGGLLYPNIEIDGKSELDNLGKYGRLRLGYLHEQKPGTYRELLLTGKLAEHIRKDYLRAHPMPEDDTLERIRISMQAQMIADEIAVDQLVCS